MKRTFFVRRQFLSAYSAAVNKKLVAAILCISLLFFPRHVKADSLEGQARIWGTLIGAVIVTAGVGTYLAIRRDHFITGCATGADRLTLLNEADHQTYTLAGDISIQPGNRLHLSGKKKKDSSGNRTFLVHQLVKDYGPCKATP